MMTLKVIKKMNKQLTQERNFDEVEFISGYVMRLIKLTEQNIKLGKENKMSECNKCGITDHEITPKQIEKYLGEKPDDNILDEQTDNMFFTYENETVCRICDLK